MIFPGGKLPGGIFTGFGWSGLKHQGSCCRGDQGWRTQDKQNDFDHWQFEILSEACKHGRDSQARRLNRFFDKHFSFYLLIYYFPYLIFPSGQFDLWRLFT